ncbi:MAG: WYL domain-containing protein, partial [Nitriliruptoraceae bacterium]
MAPKVERLVNLTIALLEARRPLTFTEIKRRTGFYRQDDTESARRMFERDKDDLRQLGVPIELAQSVFDEEPGYLVRRKDYELPDIDLTADEVAALALAVQLAGGEHARLTLSRLAARAPDPRTAPDDIPLHVTLTADAIDAFADAIVDRRVATFRYRTAGGAIGDRVVEPFAVVQRRGAWYLVGRDRDRAALRTFRLDRIVGAPRIGDVADAFERPVAFRFPFRFGAAR